MTTKYGVFSETGKGGGKPNSYVDTVKPDPRDHGLNFKVRIYPAAAANMYCCDLQYFGSAAHCTLPYSNLFVSLRSHPHARSASSTMHASPKLNTVMTPLWSP
jgi:hypothetical protein